jgi:FkbM family methyltransferase
MVYGMGNGADKLFDKFSEYGISVAEVFASDGFVRGHSFRGFKVRSFSEIRELYADFVIVLSFASNRVEVIDMLAEIDRGYDMYAPDMPVAGVDEYFNKDFYNAHYDEIIRAYNSLCDEDSKAIFSSVINYKLSGRIKFLLECFSDRNEIYSLLCRDKISVAIDAGAYNGDTAREMLSYFPGIKKIYALEPDKKNFKKLTRYSEADQKKRVIPINVAAWCEDTDGTFFGSGNRNSTAVATASFQHSEDSVRMLKIDSVTDENVDYVKYDVEGAEREAISGSRETILRCAPSLLISLYHRSRDIFELINFISDNYPDYKLYLRRLRCLPAWEIDLICVK